MLSPGFLSALDLVPSQPTPLTTSSGTIPTECSHHQLCRHWDFSSCWNNHIFNTWSLAHELDVDIEDVVKSGGDLAFVSYPEVLAKFIFAPQLYAVLFSLMLITLPGRVSAIGLFSAVTTTICDSFPDKQKIYNQGLLCIWSCHWNVLYHTGRTDKA